MTGSLLLGAGLGLGLWALAVWAFPPLPRLGVVLARLNTPPPAAPIVATREHGWVVRLGTPFARLLQDLGLPGERARRDLTVTETTVQAHLATKAVFALAGLLLPPVANVILAAGGTGAQLPLAASLVLVAAGFVAPDLQAHAHAARRRAEARHALSAYLDLVVIALAGGSGVDAALHDAAGVGHGWAFTQLRRALATARITRTSPWHTLRQLGTELDVPDLTELAATASLAGTEGAKIRASLAAKAAALRTHQLTDTEAEAQSATERMSLPVMVLFLAFLVFIGYPALHQILTGL